MPKYLPKGFQENAQRKSEGGTYMSAGKSGMRKGGKLYQGLEKRHLEYHALQPTIPFFRLLGPWNLFQKERLDWPAAAGRQCAKHGLKPTWKSASM